MTQKAAASLSSSLFARKGKASPASLLISEMEAANGSTSGRSAANGSARRKPKAQAELPLLAYVEAQAESGEDTGNDNETLAAAEIAVEAPETAEEAAEASQPAKADLPPAASLLDRGARPLRRANGRKPAMPGEAAAPPRAEEDSPPVVQADRRGDVDADNGEEAAAGDAETMAAETVSGDANVAAIEDASDDDAVAETEAAIEVTAAEAAPVEAEDEPVIVDAVGAAPPAGPKDEAAAAVVPPVAEETGERQAPEEATLGEATGTEEKPAAAGPVPKADDATKNEKPAETKPAEEIEPRAAARPASQDKAAAAIAASMALRHAKTLNAEPLRRAPAPAPSTEEKPRAVPPGPRRAGQTSRSYLWRGAAVVVLGAALGFGAYLVFAGKPATPPAPVAAALPEPVAEPAVEAPAKTVPAPEAEKAVTQTAAPQAAAAAPSPAETALPEPSFDIIRIEPDGQSIIAGRAEPSSEWILLNNGTPIASVTADVNGEWVVLPDASLVPGANAFSLVPKTERGKVAIPAPDAAPQNAPESAPASAAPAQEAPANEAPANEAQAPAAPREDVRGAEEAVEGAVRNPAPSASDLAGLLLPKPKPLLESAAGKRSVLPARMQVTADGAYEVQLASVRQTTDAARERDRLAAAFPDLLGDLELRVQEAAVEGAGIFYRVRSGAIADLGVARHICRQLEAGGQGCLVVRRAVEAAAPEPVTELVEEVPAEPAASAAGQQAERPQ